MSHKVTPILLVCFLLLFIPGVNAQVPTCDPSVPFYQVNLVGQPSGTWISPVHSRNGNCCATSSPDRCTSFEILLDTGAAMINFEIASGAIPPGSMFYQISCGPQIPVGQPICITGPGPHYLTFCKPGNNTNTYRVTSIPKPIFPKDDTARIGCSLPIHVLGLVESSISWTSVFPGVEGAYNSYLSCTSNCDTILYTPASNAPAFVDYRICGTPIATLCGYVALCDTVRIYNFAALTASVTPNPATFCAGGPGVTLTGTAGGGQTPYSYAWFNQSSAQVGTGTSYNVTTGGTYQLRVRDMLYDSLHCPATYVSVPVTAVNPPTINAGPDQTLCPTSPAVTLQGSVTDATGGIWTGGAGTFNPSNASLITVYTPTAAEIASGQVTLTLTSTGAGGGCTNATDVMVINYPPALSITLPSQALACNNSTTTLSPVVTGGTAPYGYHWNNGSSSTSITAGQGNYCLAITDAMGCSASVCANVTIPPALAISMSSTDATTNGGSDGSATASVTGGVSPYSYVWSPGGQTTVTATGLSYGVYNVTATDANGCTITSGVVVNEPRCLAFQVTASSTSNLCYGSANGTATASVSGGTSPYTYQWNTIPAQTSAAVSGLSAGTYLVTVTEANGCIDVASVTINEPSQLTSTLNHTNTSVVSGTDGSATANPAGGTAPYTYLWSNLAVTPTISNLTAGIYTVTVTDNNGCALTDSVQIDDPECASILMNTFSTSVSCPGGNDGTASAQILFGIPPYSYVWSNGGTTATISNLSAGVYTVIGWGTLMCTHFANVTVTQPSPLALALLPTNISCAGAQDGTIELTVSGGTYPYTYVWSNGLSVEDQANLSPGTYTVIVTDAHGCTATASTTITEPTPIVVGSGHVDVTCHGGNNGSIDAAISGGVFPYAYSWNSGQTTQDISGLTIGTYILTVTDANGCANATLNVPINEPSVVSIDSILTACPVPGSGVAQVTVYASGGSNVAYQVSFDNGVNFLGSGIYTTTLTAGNTYQVVVQDNNGCRTSAATTLPVNPVVDIQSVSFNPCIADGVTSIPVTLTTTGGNGGPLLASFDNGSTYLAPGVMTSVLNTGGTYQVIVKDSSGCASVTETVSIPDEIILAGTAATFNGYNVSCAGSTNGSIDLSATGGNGSYTYAWSNASAVQDVSNLAAGTYSVVVTDGNSCADTISFTLTEPAALTNTLVSVNNFNGYQVSCNGNTDGAADLTVNGGVTSYTYAWSNSASTQDISSLGAGTYSVSITDANGCVTTNSITLTEPAVLSAAINRTDVLCNGNASGALDLSVTGGVTAYSYSWSNSATTQDLLNVAAGAYNVTVTDANGCTATAAATITEPSLLTASGNVTDLTCFQSANGAIDLTVNGGAGGYNYLWNTAALTQDLSDIPAGLYSVTITDANGCVNTQSFTVTEPTLLTSVAAATTSFNGYEISCNGNTDGAVDLTVSGGTSGYTFNWSNSSTTEDISSIGAGTYSVTVTDANGCVTTNSITLTEPAVLSATINQTDVLCNGNASGALDLSVTGGVTAYSYSWSNSATTQDLLNVAAGAYNVTVTDANGCIATAAATITEPSLLTASGNVTDLTCFQSMNGAIDLTVNGGAGGYNYSWNTAALTQDLSDIPAGLYSVTITDANGCVNTQSFTVTEPTLLTSAAAATTSFNGYEISCNGNTDGAIDLTVSGGTSGYTFSWSNSSTTEDISSIGAGTYSVTVTDANGCIATSTVSLTEPTALSGLISVTDVLCNGNSTGSLDLTVSGGVTTYTYTWSNSATTEDISGIGAGAYNVTITDANGCTATASATITEPSLLTVSGAVTDLTCFQSANGAIDLTVNGGAGSYLFSWNNSSTGEDLSNISAGNYSVNVMDANGCTVNQSFTVTEPSQLVANIAATTNFNGYEVSCNGSTNGAADLTVSGGIPGYTFSWSNSATTEDLTAIGAGTYSVTITDVNGCIANASITLTEPSLLDINAAHQDVPCNGLLTGSINITMNGGVTPYAYLWSNNATTEDLSAIGAGNYTVDVTDANGCIIDTTIQITESSPVVLSTSMTHPLCNGTDNGSIDLTVSGGTPPYNFDWSGGQTTEDIISISAGQYDVVVTDQNNCTAYDTVSLVDPSVLTSTISSPLQPSGHNVSMYGGNDGSIELLVEGGSAPYQYAWNNGATAEDLSGLVAGSYSVVVTDANGCTTTSSILLDQPLSLEMPTGFTPNNDGANDFFVIHGIEAYPDNKLEVFNRWGNLVYEADQYHNNWNGYNDNGTKLPDGTYFVILTINNSDIKLNGYVDLRN